MWGSNTSASLSNSFVDWLQNSNFVILNTSNPTYTSYSGTNSLLDLTLCSTSIYHQVDCFVSDSTFESDHNPVVTTWPLLGQSSKTIKTIDWNCIMKNSTEILSSTHSDLHTVLRKVSGIIKQNTKHTVLPGTNYPPWWNISCHNFQMLKKFRTRALRNASTSDWIKHKKYAEKLRFHFKRASNNYWDTMCNITRNPRMFYSMIKRINNHSNQEVNVSNLIPYNNHYVSNPQDQSNLFLDFFSNSTHEPIPLDFNGDKNTYLNIPIQLQEVRKAIPKTRNTSPGADCIPAKWFKKLSIVSFKINNFSFKLMSQSSGNIQSLCVLKPNKDKSRAD
ncbi:hypothetical protein AVEN_154379-1 [Araneus ventricosus]|uniref:Endonuclease/exonuclease/phosphatase domain-containing protein n=1 Tax=Araneus ventricosus TaxID=182803 RepID=A0A4Y2QMH7_ARAVE|nr:hypothetical protein AVEN_154379-1 [Araneus ventricosus]